MTTHRSNRDAVRRQIRRGLQSNVTAAAYLWDGAMRRAIAEPGSGRVYRRGNVRHRASAPGEPPATDTGYLLNSVGTEIYELQAYVGNTAQYALYLERGTRHIAPRPFVRESARRVLDQMRRELRRPVT